MASKQVLDMVAADALYLLLCEQLASARHCVSSTVYDTAEQQCAAQKILFCSMLVLEKTQKKRLIGQLQEEVASIEAKLVFLNTNVIQDVELFDHLMATGVNLTELAALNQQHDKTLSPM